MVLEVKSHETIIIRLKSLSFLFFFTVQSQYVLKRVTFENTMSHGGVAGVFEWTL